MNKKIAAIAFAGATLGLFAGAPSAGAAHCTGTPADAPQPGFSYFGTDHVQESDHAEGAEGVHMGNPGASNCRETTGSPSERAPGRNK